MNQQSNVVFDACSMVYAPSWSRLFPEPRRGAIAAGQCLLLVPAAQVAVQQKLAQWLPQLPLLALRADNVADVLARVLELGCRQVAFVTRSAFRDGVDDDAIIAFQRCLKAFSGLSELRLDIITVNAIAAPAPHAVTHPVDGVFIGLGQTAAKEFGQWQVNCLSLTAFDGALLQYALESVFVAPPGSPIVVGPDGCLVSAIVPVQLERQAGGRGLRHGASYMIIGANGGIGGVLARHLAERYQARLILVGRRPEAHALLGELAAHGASAVYEQVDLADKEQVEALMARHPQIDGIVHSALVLDDASLLTMSEASLMSVLRPKVHGTVNLVNAIRGRSLDFVLMFSSIQSYIANAGQANYTAACVAKDALAALLREVLMIDAKVINWGFWGNIGIVASDMYRERMRKLEIGSIEAQEGVAIIERLLESSEPQITVVKATSRALQRLRIAPRAGAPETLEQLDRAAIAAIAASVASVAAPFSLADIMPAFVLSAPRVRNNIAASDALQRYVRGCMARLALPPAVAAKHGKLADAIARIPAADGSEPGREQLLSQFPELAGHVGLLDACLPHYPAMLAGSVDPLTVMFPEGSFRLVEPIYRDNPLADYFNQTVAQVVDNYARRCPGKELRVLEIGAGTGSTAQFVLPVLRGRQASYTFTDLSFAFLNKARQRFAEFPFVRYEIFNVENPPRNDAQFDVVIATNVIHATADLPAVLANVRSRIAPGGIFVLNEITSRQDYATVTFGLTEGWWLSVDQYRIPASPLVDGATWRRLLLDADFSATVHHGNADQQVIVAGVALEEGAPAAELAPVAELAQAAPSAPAQPGAGDEQRMVQDYIRAVIAHVMHAQAAEIEIDRPFNEFGIDSLIALELLKPFRDDLGYLPATVLFEYPTVAALAAHLLAQFGDAVRKAAGTATAAPALAATPALVVDATPAPAIDAPPAAATTTATAATGGATPEALLQAVRALLREVIAETMYMQANDIDPDQPFREYGIDSIIALELLKPLREHFGYLPATLLFEHPSVDRLAAYLGEHYGDAAQKLVAPAASAPEPAPASVTASVTVSATAPATAVGEAPGATAGAPAHPPRPHDIAIVGMAGQFPEADDIDEFWRNLRDGRDCSSAIPAQRWPMAGFTQRGSPIEGGSYTRVGAFVRDIDAFDNRFFHITPLEAQRMDPQERLFLQTAYQAIADAGYARPAMRGSDTGVFVGVMNGAYAWHRPAAEGAAQPSSLFWSIANRTSYLFDLKGPSMAVDTACSSSLTALHLAAQALRNGDCDSALIGGVNLIVHPRQYQLLCGMHMLSRSGSCKPFGQGADGFVDGEGVCCVVAKRYQDALRDGDRIYGVIRASALNAGGQSNGYSAPNPDAQAKVIAKAMARAGLAAGAIGYVEAHGTGTELGDPIEIRGLSAAFDGVPAQSVALGSVKGNIGHLESAAGLSSVIKVLLQLHHKTLLPSINADTENPHLNLAASPFRLQRQLQPWTDERPLVASVSSYGAGGANAHAIIQGAVPAPMPPASHGGVYIAALSARTENGLQRQIEALRASLGQRRVRPHAIAYTLCCAREHFAHRSAYVFRDQDDLLAQLRGDARPGAANPPLPAAAQAQVQAIVAAGAAIDAAQARSVAEAFVAGAAIAWDQLYPVRDVASLPGYAFEKSRFWVDSDEAAFSERGSLPAQHTILGVPMAPAAWSLSHYLDASGSNALHSVLWRSVVHDIAQVQVRRDGEKFAMHGADRARTYCEGLDVGPLAATAPAALAHDAHGNAFLDHVDIYRRFEASGYCYGPDLRVLRWARVGEGSVRALLQVERDWGYRLSPALLDGGLQAAILMPGVQHLCGPDEILVPYHLGAIEVMRIPKDEAVFCICQLQEGGAAGRSVVTNIQFLDAGGAVLIAMREVTSVVAKKSLLTATATEAPTPAPAGARTVPVYDLA